ncbi:hypothetical protein [Pedobacter nutrimenti]|uniref:hypothetical protein n=1 Tax=Pedobacter nutrimenti TaxID=1241337 RepID=UPI002930ADCD|nr:hypothetical protein [Pedobacter nutrimenti]
MMLKFFSERYYYILNIALVLFALNLAKEKVISVLSGQNSHYETLIRSLFIYSFFCSCILVFILSIVMLFVKEGHGINRFVLITAPLLIAIFFFALLTVFGIANVFPVHL